MHCELFRQNVRRKLIRVGKNTTFEKTFFFILVCNYRQSLEFIVVFFFFVSANIITVGQRCLTIKERERSRQNQAITPALSASSNTNMVADIILVYAEGGA